MAEPVFTLNTKPMLAALGNLDQALSNPTPLLKIAGSLMVRSIHQTFREGGSPAGSWRPLFASTMQQQFETRGQRRRQAYTPAGTHTAGFARFVAGKRILMGPSRQLYRSINFSVDAPAGAVWIGTNLLYARIHQLGGVITPRAKKFLCFPIGGGRFIKTKQVTMPARPFVVLRPEDPGRISSAWADYFRVRFGAKA